MYTTAQQIFHDMARLNKYCDTMENFTVSRLFTFSLALTACCVVLKFYFVTENVNNGVKDFASVSVVVKLQCGTEGMKIEYVFFVSCLNI